MIYNKYVGGGRHLVTLSLLIGEFYVQAYQHVVYAMLVGAEAKELFKGAVERGVMAVSQPVAHFLREQPLV